ncbi:MAG: patatin-like phospholipase family protein [Flavobacteriales bacterium]
MSIHSKKFIRCIIVWEIILLTLPTYGQRVGVVLSGGGSSGVAHVGVLKALEENNIPIDYITGTSMGALVGGMYAMGYSPSEIEEIITSPMFNNWVFGRPDERYVFYYRDREPNGSWIGLKFRIDSAFQYTLPTNIISTAYMDFAFMERTAPITAKANRNFDSLFVPFRAVAADVFTKSSVIFRQGDLGIALRASTSYPFVYRPLKLGDRLLYDGGLYNNFPSDVMYHDFLPDVIIGSTVAFSMNPPDEDDITSQIKSMLMYYTSYESICDDNNMIIIRPKIPSVSILDFSRSRDMVQGGYETTLSRIDDIKQLISRRTNPEELKERRHNFVHDLKEMNISKVELDGVNRSQKKYIHGILGSKRKSEHIDRLRPGYHKLVTDERIKHIQPMAEPDSLNQDFVLKLKIKQDKDFDAQFGGIFSSRPINTGFIALRYKRFRNIGTSIDLNTYFGKFYSSGQIMARFDFPFSIPFFIETDFTANVFDYFNSSTAFFEDVKPSYLIQRDQSFNANLTFPFGRKSRIKIGAVAARMYDDYYQTPFFLKADTADRTFFNHASTYIFFERSTLNRKFYANAGTYFSMRFRYLSGLEETIPGSTSITDIINIRKSHDFYRFNLIYDNYFNKRGALRIGVYGELVASNQPFFQNYTASILQSAAFSPVPEMRTLFLENYRAHNYGGAGLKTLFAFTSRLDLRLEAYIFQPHREIIRADNQTAFYGNPFERRYYIGSAALVFNTPVAPLCLSVNYYEREQKPWSVIFTAGFLLFNRRALQ